MPHSNIYAVFGSDIFLALERVLKFYLEPFPLGERIKASSNDSIGGEENMLV
jgi:hypothetical protein